MGYLLEQLQAYQQQLRELELHRQWQQHTAAQERGRLPPIAGASGQSVVRRATRRGSLAFCLSVDAE